jgi:hypothetical protein
MRLNRIVACTLLLFETEICATEKTGLPTCWLEKVVVSGDVLYLSFNERLELVFKVRSSQNLGLESSQIL